MRTISAAEANRHFSKLLREVAAGKGVIVTSRGEPVAKVVPVEPADLDEQQGQKAWEDHIARLRSQPVLNRGKITRDEIYDE
jgi:prevent-host-death family protein